MELGGKFKESISYSEEKLVGRYYFFFLNTYVIKSKEVELPHNQLLLLSLFSCISGSGNKPDQTSFLVRRKTNLVRTIIGSSGAGLACLIETIPNKLLTN